MDQIQTAAFLIKFHSNISMLICLYNYIIYGYYWTASAELDNCNRDYVAHKA